MLELRDIKKRYELAAGYVEALRGVSINFRENEFVAILGQSGCGKTTLLNIIGGLDRYTSGDLVINRVSTKQYKDRDWDRYRNHSIGFIFQSYNLIPHQNVLSNVELALTISGVSREERRRRAISALEKVGLGDQLYKKPNQMSGGQMQRVAIARALVNDPDILLADEPTGALDSQTSVAVMEILKEISKDKLIIMVTHNPDLANEYANRIVKLKDGLITDDSNPFNPEDEKTSDEIMKAHLEKEREKGKKTSMSFFTALALSFKNLMTKKTRTLLTSFAGSIGIIGIALILSVSSGFQAYVDTIERNTVSGYPITINETTMDMTTLLTSLVDENAKNSKQTEENRIYSSDIMVSMMKSMTGGITTNNLKAFKDYIESDECTIKSDAADVKYSYGTSLNTYLYKNGQYVKGLKDSTELFDAMGMGAQMSAMSVSSGGIWTELVGDDEYIESQYKLLYGAFPKEDEEVVLIVNEENKISDYTLYCLGIRDVNELKKYLAAAVTSIANGTENTVTIDATDYSFDEIISCDFRVVTDSDFYRYDSESGLIIEKTEAEMNAVLDGAQKIKVVGIVSTDDATSVGAIGYRGALMNKMIDKANESEVVARQKANTEKDLFTGTLFKVYTDEDDLAQIKTDLLANDEFKSYLSSEREEKSIPDIVTDDSLYDMMVMMGAKPVDLANTYLASENSYETNLSELGYVDYSTPKAINIYPIDFESKDRITQAISDYNDKVEKKDKITYTDMVAMLMSSVTTIVNAVSYVLIAFVSISLVVSSIMIGIITYISVLERTKEIGILRAMGASKRDISRVFNAETTIVGLTAGVLGIIISSLLLLPINAILHNLTEIEELSAILPPLGAGLLVVISVVLTLIAGLIPSRIASKRDPVIALRTE